MLTAIATALLIAPVAKSRTPILTYHDVIPTRTKDSLWFDCSVKELTEQLSSLRKRGAVFVSLADVERALTGGAPLPDRAIAITFADNYQGFYKYAFPFLKRERIPVAMFVHTGFVGSRVGRPKMTWDQLRELDRTGLVTIGSQTVTHRSLTELSTEEINRELNESKRVLEQQLGQPVRYLAYPNGAFNKAATTAAKRAGYALAFTERLIVAERRPNNWEVPRWVHTKWESAWKAGL